VEHQVVDMRVHGSLRALRAKIRSFRPDLIGISMVSFEYKRSYALIGRMKSWAPDAAIVAGGPHLSILKERVFRECPELDLGIEHEGELSVAMLCRGDAPFSGIPGLLYRDGLEVGSGPPQVVRTDLDSVSFPRYQYFDLRQYVKEICIVTSRGCPYRCTFCPNSLTAKRFRARSAQNVADEIEYWYSRGIRLFNVDDDNFTLIKERVYQICDEIERRGMKDLFIRCSNGLRADRVDHELLTRMKEVGVREVAFGADGGNNRVLQEVVHKGETLEDIERAMRDALDLGLGVRLFIIVGSPGETPSDIEDSIALAQRYPVSWLHLNNPIPYPGTQLYEQVESHNWFVIPPEQYLNGVTETSNTPVFETPELPRAVRAAYLARCARIERDVRRRAAERVFRRLPIFRTVVGYVFASRLGEWLLFRSKLARSIINRIWYRKMIGLF
jgi:radical SAM superfamily enzyme YgiQ (UPF0313 family)